MLELLNTSAISFMWFFLIVGSYYILLGLEYGIAR